MAVSPFRVFLVPQDADGKPILPESADAITYLVTQNGPMLMHRNAFFEAIVPAQSLPMLAEIEETAESRLPKIPAPQVAQIVEFFRTIYRRYKAEAVLLIAFNEMTGAYACIAPEQIVSATKIDYEPPRQDAAPEGFTFVGTAHSHAADKAYHSQTDDHDEGSFDGLHLTFGCLDRPAVLVSASLVIGKKRFLLDPSDCLCGLDPVFEAEGRPRLTERLFFKIFDGWALHLNEDAKAFFEDRAGFTILYDWLGAFIAAGAGKKPSAPEFLGYAVVIPEGEHALAPNPTWFDLVVPDVSVPLYDFRRYVEERVDAEREAAAAPVQGDGAVMEGTAEGDASGADTVLAAPSEGEQLRHAVRMRDYASTTYASGASSAKGHPGASASAVQDATYHGGGSSTWHREKGASGNGASGATVAQDAHMEDDGLEATSAVGAQLDDHGSLQPQTPGETCQEHTLENADLTAEIAGGRKVAREM